MANRNNFSVDKRKFFISLGIYVIVMSMLIAVNLTSTPDYFWAIWPLMGWGIGVILHALNVFVFTDRSNLP